MENPIRFHAWNTLGRVLRVGGDLFEWVGRRVQLRLYGWSGTTDAIADEHRALDRWEAARDATPAEVEAYRAGRDGEAHPPGPRARPPQRNTDSGAVGG